MTTESPRPALGELARLATALMASADGEGWLTFEDFNSECAYTSDVAHYLAACSPAVILQLVALATGGAGSEQQQEQLHSGKTGNGQLESSATRDASVCECGHSAADHADEGPGFTCVGWISDAFTNGPPSDAGHFCPCEEFRPAAARSLTPERPADAT